MDRSELRKIANKPIHRKVSDAIEGQKVIGIARDIKQMDKPIKGSSKHRTQGVILKSDAFCIVDKEFKLRE